MGGTKGTGTNELATGDDQPHSNATPARVGMPRCNLRRDWPGLLAMLLIAIGFSFIPVMHVFTKPTGNKDYSRWWNAAMSIRHGEPLYPVTDVHDESFIYPPASAVLFYTPLSALGYLAMVVMVAGLTLAGYVAAVAISVWYARGRAGGEPASLYIIPVAASLGFAWDAYYLGQPNLALLGVMMVGFFVLDRGHAVLAGSLFAAAAVIKAFPVTVLGYLIWRRHFRAAGAMVLALLLLLLVIPGPFRGFQRNLDETNTWVQRMVLSTSGNRLANQPERAFRWGNQSLLSVTHRLTRHIDAGEPEDPLYVNVVDISPTGSFVVFGVIAGSLCLAYVGGMRPKRLLTRRTRGLEYAILLILITIFSPKAGTYYYAWTLPGLVMVTSEAMRSTRCSRRWWLLWACVWTSFAVTTTGITQMFGVWLPQSLGSTMWGAMIVLVALLALLFEARRRPDLDSDGPTGLAPARPTDARLAGA